jgi:hypothetical protein
MSEELKQLPYKTKEEFEFDSNLMAPVAHSFGKCQKGHGTVVLNRRLLADELMAGWCDGCQKAYSE